MSNSVENTLKLALKALEWATSCIGFEDFDDMPEALEELNKAHEAITAIKEALSTKCVAQSPITESHKRKPLTDEKVSLIAHNIDSGDWNDLNFKECWHEGFKSGFREAEIEHNIKE